MNFNTHQLKSISSYVDVVRNNYFRSYQQDWIDSFIHNRLTAIVGARQIGKSSTIAIASIIYATGYKIEEQAHNPSDVFIASKDLKTAKNIISMLNKHIDNIEQIYKLKIRNKKLGGIQEVVLLNGRKITSMPGTPNSLRGFTGCVIIDELSANNWDPEEILAEALSITSSDTRFKVIICTNADMEGSFVHDFFYSDKEDHATRRAMWSCFNTTIYDAYEELPSHIASIKDTISSNMWKRFYENAFLGAGSGLLDLIYLQSRVTTTKPNIGPLTFMGVDPGFSEQGNPTGIVIVTIDNNICYTIYEELMFSPSLDFLCQHIANLKKQFGCSKILIDQGTVGYHVLQNCKKLIGEISVEGISCTSKNQITWFNMLLNLLQDNKILFCNNKFIVQDLSSISMSGSSLIVPERPLGIYRTVEPFIAPNAKGYKIHADSAMALLMLMEIVNNYMNKHINIPGGFKRIGGR